MQDKRVDELTTLAESKAAAAEARLQAQSGQAGTENGATLAAAPAEATTAAPATLNASAASTCTDSSANATAQKTVQARAPAPVKPKWARQKEHRVEFDQTQLPGLVDLELDDKAKMAQHLWQLLQHARLHGSTYAYTFATFGLVHSDGEYIVGKEIATKILVGGQIVAEDVISDQLMDLLTFQLSRGLEDVATKKEERMEAKAAADKAFLEHMPKLKHQSEPY